MICSAECAEREKSDVRNKSFWTVCVCVCVCVCVWKRAESLRFAGVFIDLCGKVICHQSGVLGIAILQSFTSLKR